MKSATAILKRMTQPDKSKFEQLVEQALAIHRELIATSNTYGDARDEKLSAKAYLAEALANAHCDLATIEKLDPVIAKLRDDNNADLLRFVAQATKQAAATRMDQGVNLRPPTGNLHHFVNYDNAAFVGVMVQASMIGTNPLQLVALAAYRATRDFPDNFGNIDDWDKHVAALEEKHARLNELYAQIAETWKDAPIEWDGVSPLIRYGDITMPVAPPDTLGERLCIQLA